MWTRIRFLLVLATLVGGACLVAAGDVDPDVTLDSVVEIWTDVLRDVDQLGLKVTRISDEEEMQLGRRIATELTVRWRADAAWSDYVSVVGARVQANARRKGITYEFHVIDTDMVNAFALPGGQVLITTGMLEFLESEAELAAILGHEIAHVDLRHCIELQQHGLALERAGLGPLGLAVELPRRLITQGFSKYQELEADTQGMRLSMLAGYDPRAAAAVFERFMEKFAGREPAQPTTAVGEVTRALEEAMGSYFDSHPAEEQRMNRLRRLVETNRWRMPRSAVYRGVRNHRERVASTRQRFSEEAVRLP